MGYSPYQMGYYPPWYYNFNQMSYANYQYPFAWGNYGINGSHYPYWGNAGAAKPNIYVQGNNTDSLRLTLDLKEEAYILSASPKLTKQEWKVNVKNNKFIIDGITYPYIFFSGRYDTKKLKPESGFCTEKDSLISDLTDILKKAQYPDSAIKDFEAYWKIKMPPAENYCVFPIEDKQLSNVYKLKLEPNLAEFVRFTFYVVPQFKNGDKFLFRQKPTNQWKYIPRSPSSQKSKLTIFEWGVSFEIEN
jgi:hypothetical protein